MPTLIHSPHQRELNSLKDILAGKDCHFSQWLPLEAISRAQNKGERFDIAILDVSAPLVWEVCRELVSTTWRTQIIFVLSVELSKQKELELRTRASVFNCAGFMRMGEAKERLERLVEALMENL